MPARRSASLARRFPRRVEIPLLLASAAALLIAGMTLPALETRTLFFWRDEYSIYMNVLDLGRNDRRAAAMILAIASIGYPAVKLLVLGYFWVAPFPVAWRARVIRWLRLLGRWAMIDVFAITSIVLASMTIGPLEATPRLGLYLYAGGIITLMLIALLMDRMAGRGS